MDTVLLFSMIASMASTCSVSLAALVDFCINSATEGNVMRLSLLRGPTEPDPNCDMGTHRFTWAIYPHAGTYTESDVAQVAYAFNAPMNRQFALFRFDAETEVSET